MPTTISTSQIGPDETPVIVSNAGHTYVSQSYDQIVPCVRTPIPSGSGGRQLDNLPVGSLIIRNGSGNNLMFVGGVGQNAPFSGRGISLYANETMTLPVKNMNLVSVMATVSGEYIECMGFLAGQAGTLDISGMFIPPDETPPTLVTVSPTSGISGVATNSEIWAKFNECINPDSASTSVFTVRISGSSTNVSGIVFVDSQDCSQVWFQPYSGLISGSTMYVARVAGGASGIMDVAGNALQASGRWHWTTEAVTAPDTTPPQVSGTNPASGAINVSRFGPYSVLFSEQMASGRINTTNIRLTLSGNNSAVTVSLQPDLKTAIITPVFPDDQLNEARVYTLKFTVAGPSGITDLAGNAMSPDVNIPFFTELEEDIAYNISNTGLSTNLDNDKFRVGFRIRNGTHNPDYKGQQMNKFRVYLKKTGSPLSGIASGLTLHIRKDAGGIVQFSPPFTQFLNPALLTTSLQPYDFYNADSAHLFAGDDKVEVQWLSGTSSGRVEVAYVNTNANNGVAYNEYVGSTYSGASYTEYSGRDLAGNMSVE